MIIFADHVLLQKLVHRVSKHEKNEVFKSAEVSKVLAPKCSTSNEEITKRHRRCYVVYYVTHPRLIKTCLFTMCSPC